MLLVGISNPFFLSYFHSDLLGKLIFILLISLSLVSWTLLIHKVRVTKRLQRQAAQIRHHFQQQQHYPLHLKSGQGSTARNAFSNLYHTLQQAAVAILNKNQAVAEQEDPRLTAHDIDSIIAHVDATIAAEAQQLEKHLFILSTTVGLAPLMGLLGTVWDILITLSDLQMSRTLGSQGAMLGGLSMALGTTVLGLIVAIPALAGYNYLRAQIRNLTSEMEDFSATVIGAVELAYRTVESGAI